MKNNIVNRVSNSPLITINLDELRLKGQREFFDLNILLENELIVREKKIRDFIRDYNWNKFSNKFVAINCTSEVILPSWTKLLIISSINPYAKKVIIGSMENLETILFKEVIDKMDFKIYKDKAIILKGCSDPKIPDSAYGFLIEKLQGIAKKISYGEACSSVPLWKSN